MERPSQSQNPVSQSQKTVKNGRSYASLDASQADLIIFRCSFDLVEIYGVKLDAAKLRVKRKKASCRNRRNNFVGFCKTIISADILLTSELMVNLSCNYLASKYKCLPTAQHKPGDCISLPLSAADKIRKRPYIDVSLIRSETCLSSL